MGNFANDSMHTSLCLQFPARTVGATCVYLACRNCKVQPIGGAVWTDVLGIGTEDLACASLQIVELIADKKGCDVTKMFAGIRAELDGIRDGKGGVTRKQDSRVGPADNKRPRY